MESFTFLNQLLETSIKGFIKSYTVCEILAIYFQAQSINYFLVF